MKSSYFMISLAWISECGSRGGGEGVGTPGSAAYVDPFSLSHYLALHEQMKGLATRLSSHMPLGLLGSLIMRSVLSLVYSGYVRHHSSILFYMLF